MKVKCSESISNQNAIMISKTIIYRQTHRKGIPNMCISGRLFNDSSQSNLLVFTALFLAEHDAIACANECFGKKTAKIPFAQSFNSLKTLFCFQIQQIRKYNHYRLQTTKKNYFRVHHMSKIRLNDGKARLKRTCTMERSSCALTGLKKTNPFFLVLHAVASLDSIK